MKCEQDGCMIEARGAFVWPGRTLSGACFVHLMKAVHVADALGFQLDLRPLDVLIEARAKDTVERLRSMEVRDG